MLLVVTMQAAMALAEKMLAVILLPAIMLVGMKLTA
jgi:hypothetical protein